MALILVAAPAQAAPVVPRICVSGVDYDLGTVSVAAYTTDSTREVALSVASEEVTRVVLAPGRTKAVFPPYRLSTKVIATVIAYDGDGAVQWTKPLTLDPMRWRPARPKVNASSGTIVGSSWSFTGTSVRPYTLVRARVRETWESTVITAHAGVNGDFGFSLMPMPRGPVTIDIAAKNGFGTSPWGGVRVYNLGGGLPTAWRYVLLDKSVLWLYHVRGGRVYNAWPVAIGTPQTPTPTGTFRIGAPQPSSGDWGVLRRRLYRVSGGKLYGTAYYIHGTDEPWSIGMEASHGCVRMYNYHVRQFAKVVPNYTLVKIK